MCLWKWGEKERMAALLLREVWNQIAPNFSKTDLKVDVQRTC